MATDGGDDFLGDWYKRWALHREKAPGKSQESRDTQDALRRLRDTAKGMPPPGFAPPYGEQSGPRSAVEAALAENARLRVELATAKADLAEARREVGRMSLEAIRHITEMLQRDKELRELRRQLADRVESGLKLTKAEWRKLVSLVHPDVHSSRGETRRLLAEECTKLLIRFKPE